MRRGAAVSGQDVAGDLQVLPDGTVEGWLWSRERPDQRLIAEVLVDDASVGVVVAAIFRRDLASQGVGDGRHGFRLPLPPGTIPADAPVVVSAREQGSAHVFARIVREGAGLAPQHRTALDSVTAGVRGLWERLEPLLAGPPGEGKADRLRTAFGQLSEQLATRTPDTAALALEHLWRVAGPLDLPRLGRPTVSLILPSGPDALATLGRLRALAPALREAAAEIVLLDDAADPATALLPALAPNLVYLRADGPDAVARGLAGAMGSARGTLVALLEAGPPHPSATVLLDLARHRGRTVLLGAATLAACARVAAPGRSPPDHAAPARLGLRIALSRDLLTRAGGLEPAMVDGAALESVDLWLRCRLLGADALAWHEPAGPADEAAPQHPHPRQALQALAAFRHRWSGGTA